MDSSSQVSTISQAMQQAMQYHNAGNLQLAESIYRQVLQAEPNNYEALHLLGVIAAQVENYEVAASLIEKAIQIKNSLPNFYNSLGNVYWYQGKLDEAADTFQHALTLQPNNAKVYSNLGNVYRDQGKLDEAVDCYQHSLSLDSEFAEAHNNLGNALRYLDKITEAIECYQRALALNSDYVDAHNNLGIALGMQDKLDESMACSQRALALNPNYAEAYNNIANILADKNDLDAATENYQQALRLQPNLADAHFGYSAILLKTGDLAAGWREYEWRLSRRQKTGPFQLLKQPQWDGSNLNGRRLLVHWEQGLGDTIHFGRYLSLIKGGTVIFACQPALAHLFDGVSGVDTLVITPPDTTPEIAYDVWIPLLSLPNIFATTLDNIPALPYIYPDTKKVKIWQARFQTTNFKIGIVWAGNPKYPDDSKRSCPLSHFAPLAKLPNTTIFSLQKDEAAKQPVPEGMEIISLTEDLEDFTDTAAAIANLDLVISVDTAVAHLAGAMGKPVWTLLPFVADWRWLLNRNDTPWYPTMRLFWQPRPGAWGEVFEQVVNELSTLKV